MPCVFCQAPDHTLKNCDSQIAQSFLMDVIAYHMMYPFNLVGQITFLMRYTNPQLAVICKQLRTCMTGRKEDLIYFIIRYLFQSRTSVEMMLSLTQENLDDINVIYEYSYSASSYLPGLNRSSARIFTNVMRTKIMVMLDHFYQRAYGIRRYGLSQHNYYNMVTEHRANPHTFNIQEFINRAANPNQNEHLKKLDFRVEIDASLQVQDCSICCDEKPNARLGCSHEYCVDCVFGSAKVRNKSFITCAMCRAEIKSVQVETETLKNELLQKISTV